MRKQVATSLFLSAILTSIFVVFKLTGITDNTHWAYILFTMWLPILITIAVKHWQDTRPWPGAEALGLENNDEEPIFETIVTVLRSKDETEFERLVTDFKRHNQGYVETCYLYSEGHFVAIMETRQWINL